MRSLAVLAFAAIVALQSAPAASPLGAQGDGRWEGVPSLSLRPPANRTPGAGAWKGGAHWQGRTNWAGPGARYAGPRWSNGFRAHYFRPRPGVFLPPVFISPGFQVQDWRSYGLAQPGSGQYWMRYDDDALLLDGRGYVHETVPGVGWRDDDHGDEGAWYPDDAVTCCGDDRLSYAPAVHYVLVGTTTVIIQQPAVVTRTSYIEEDVVRPAPRKAKRSWKRAKVWKPRAQCRC